MIRFAFLTVAALMPLPALAHHPMGGAAPQTAWHGLLSGIGHPVIGLDHLAFLIGAGLLASVLARRAGALAIGLFVAAGMIGTLLHLAGIGLGPVEALVAGTSVIAGLVLLAVDGPPRFTLVAAGFAIAGLVHGHAYAEAVVGAEATPILAYLAGLALTQAALVAGVAYLAREARTERRLAGAAVAIVGAAALATTIFA